MFIVAATILSVFHIERQRDSEGAPFEFTYSGGLVRCVERFSLEEPGGLTVFIQSSQPVPMLHHSKGQKIRGAYSSYRQNRTVT
jgi:hypothetical protein